MRRPSANDTPHQDSLRIAVVDGTISGVKAFNFVSAVVTATVLAVGAFTLALPDEAGSPAWRLLVAWVAGALVWAVVYSVVRDGPRATWSALARR